MPVPQERRWRLDITPLRQSRDFRLVFSSGVITYLGSMMTFVALPFQVATLTGSYVAVGLIGVVEVVPLIVFGLYGGALADAVDRKRMVLWTEVASLVLSLVLMANAMVGEPRLWVLYVTAFLFSIASSLQRPSLDALTPRVVTHDQLAAAGVLSSIRFNLGSIVGPGIAGLILAAGGAQAVYLIDALTYAASILLIARVATRSGGSKSARAVGVSDIAEGLRYAWSRKDLLGTYAVDLAAMILAFPYALFPFVAQQFDAEWSLGLLYSAPAVGGLAVTLTSGWVSRVHRHGRAIVVAATAWGMSIALIGLAPGIWIVLLLLCMAGAADMISGQFRQLMWNQTIPDDVRGRLAGVEMLSYSVGPLLGQVGSSGVAALTSLRMAFASGGVACVIAVGICAALLPSMWRYDDRTNHFAQREREHRARENPHL